MLVFMIGMKIFRSSFNKIIDWYKTNKCSSFDYNRRFCNNFWYFSLVFALGLSCHYDYRLTLITLCFLPFIVSSQILVNRGRRGGREGEKKRDIEAVAVLSECVINTKTIYSFNFQKPIVEMYLGILDVEKKFF